MVYAPPGSPERVCLLLADLSGYTGYLAAAEPQRAPALAADLMGTVVRGVRPTFRLARVEGAATFASGERRKPRRLAWA